MKTVAILGSTGRLGSAMVRAFEGWDVRGLSHREPYEDEPRPRHPIVGDRRDVEAVRETIRGADLVIDMLAFNAPGVEVVLGAVEGLDERPAHLIMASTTAIFGPPDDEYGAGKREAQRLYEERFGGLVHTLVLPRLVPAVDYQRREYAYLNTAAEGSVMVGGDPERRQVIAPVDGVAAVARALAERPARVPAGPLNVGPPAAITVGDAVAALVSGAGLSARIVRHPDRSWRGPHGGGEEPLDTSRLRSLLPEIDWEDPLAVYERLGAWLARQAPEASRPKQVVKQKHKKFIGQGVVDIHGARDQPAVAEPIPALERIAAWLSPAFYIDTGRPCNSACIYCAVPPHLDTQGFTPLERMLARIDVGLAAGCDKAILIGGEPTIHPDFLTVLAGLQNAGLDRHVVMTNGKKLADAAFVDEMVRLGLGTVHLSIDTADPKTYASLSRTTGTQDAQWAALSNALSHDSLNVYIYAAVTGVNADGIPALLRAVKERTPNRSPPVCLGFVKPVGDALTHADSVLLSPQRRAEIARDAVKVADSVGLELGVRHVPACLCPDLLPRLADYYMADFSVDLATGERMTWAHQAQYKRFVPACDGCAHQKYCSGVYEEEERRFGVDGVRALGSEGLV